MSFTTNQKLVMLGFKTKPSGQYRKAILKSGRQVFEGTVYEVEKWLGKKGNKK